MVLYIFKAIMSLVNFNSAAATAKNNAYLVAYVKENLQGSMDADLLDFFLLTVIDFADEEFPITEDDAMKWLHYSKTNNFRRMYSSHLIEGEDFTMLRSEQNPSGGRPKIYVRFTVDGFKDLCMAAGTDQGRRVRDYYRTFEKVHARYQAHMSETSRQLLITSAQEAREQKADAVHRALLSGRKKGRSVTYLAIVMHIDEEWFMLKIGETDDVPTRAGSLNKEFGKARFVYMLDCLDAHGLEQHIKKHAAFAPYLSQEYFGSTETAIVNAEIYEKIKAEMNKAHVRFDTLDREQEVEMRRLIVKETENELERERLDKVDIPDAETRAINARRDVQMRDDVVAELNAASAHLAIVTEMVRACPRELHLFEMYKLAHDAVEKRWNTLRSMALETKASIADEFPTSEKATIIPVPEVKRRFKNYIQQYDPNTLELMNVFEGPNHAVVHMGKGAAQNLTDASRSRTVYCGYRWAEVPKTGDPHVAQDIGATEKTKACRLGLIARLSDDLQTVLEVFESQMAAAAKKGCTNSAICQMLKKTTPGHESSRWVRWCDVSLEMQKEYLGRATLPGKPQRNGRAVVRVDAVTGKDIDRFDTAAEVLAKFAIGSDSLKNACNGVNVAPLKGYLWRWA